MAKTWQPPKLKALGNSDNSVSDRLKVWVMQDNVIVCGIVGEGTSRELQAKWDSPFEQDNPGSMFEKVGGLLQTGAISETTKGYTSKSTLNSAQVWNGNRPVTISLALQLYALSNPQIEVEDAIAALQEFASPQVNEKLPLGRIPGTVSVSIGRKYIYPEMVIESVSDPLDSVRDRNGNRIRCTVQIEMQSSVMLNRTDIEGTRGR